MDASPVDRCPAVRHRHPAMSGRVNPVTRWVGSGDKDRTNGVGFDKTIRTECVGPDRDRFAGGGRRVWCGCHARAFFGVELRQSRVQKMGEGKQ
ncbi:hypothetical protein IEQ34_000138 [Dendrobium chrysotoxum]|uniref:Uncharacterized protein n=1 Tax=Dendrobium chrysotoxum TaxID=161865 RepID=A0AAV7H8A2_DENCH|nr:hypothetical protein IEQ34_000138 [Dendrobium chrysotoxum]